MGSNAKKYGQKYSHDQPIWSIIKYIKLLLFLRVHVEQSADGRGLDLVFRSIQTQVSISTFFWGHSSKEFDSFDTNIPDKF